MAPMFDVILVPWCLNCFGDKRSSDDDVCSRFYFFPGRDAVVFEWLRGLQDVKLSAPRFLVSCLLVLASDRTEGALQLRIRLVRGFFPEAIPYTGSLRVPLLGCEHASEQLMIARYHPVDCSDFVQIVWLVTVLYSVNGGNCCY